MSAAVDRFAQDFDRALTLLNQAAPAASAPHCPLCRGDDYPLRRWSAPGVLAGDCTLTWRECSDCGHKSEAA